MVLPIVFYPDPVLRAKGKPVTKVTDEIRALAANMLDTMRDAHGVGLAAQQVGVPLQLAIVDVSHDEECVTYCRVNGEDRKLAEICPLIFVNPKLEFGKAKTVSEEGCLSFPDLRENIKRPEKLKATLTLAQRRDHRARGRRPPEPRHPARDRSSQRRALHRPHVRRRQTRPQAQAARTDAGVGGETGCDAAG